MARRGRPRKAGKRKPSGDLKFTPDSGSPHLLAHRVLDVLPHLAGSKIDKLLDHDVAQDKRSAYPLGILLLQGKITPAHHYAGRRYAGLFVRAIRGVGMPSCLANLIGSGGVDQPMPAHEPENDAAEEIHIAYKAARRVLQRVGQRIAEAIDNVAVYETKQASESLPLIVRGLEDLKRHFNEVDKRRSA